MFLLKLENQYGQEIIIDLHRKHEPPQPNWLEKMVIRFLARIQLPHLHNTKRYYNVIRKEGGVMEFQFKDMSFITTHTAVYLQYPAGQMDEALDSLPFPISIELPCGNVFKQESRLGFPKEDVSCPCGNENHWFVRHEIIEVV